MFPALFKSLFSSPQTKPLNWLRSLLMLSMAFGVSACAYDGVYLGTHGGSHSGYYGGYQGGYPVGYQEEYQNGFQGHYYRGDQYHDQPPRYDHQGRSSRLDDAKRREHDEIYRRHFESQRRFEHRLHEARKHQNAQRRH